MVKWIFVREIFKNKFFILLLLIRYPNEDNQWSILLKRQEEYYQMKLTGLHSVLISTHNALKNVCTNLEKKNQ
jgi:hypothetical protein